MTRYLFLAIVMLAACNDETRSSDVFEKRLGSASLYEFKLSDGTKCAAWYHAITCNWQQPNRDEPK